MKLQTFWSRVMVLGMLMVAGQVAAEPVEITLFPEGAKEPAGFVAAPDGLIEGKNDGVKRVGNVSSPTLSIYRPETGANGTAVLVCPGGGYSILAIEHEGTQVCEWLNTLGVTAVLLKYRVPRRDPAKPYGYPLEDARQAMRLLRTRGAAEWGIKPDKIGVLGFSAGGNLSVMLALNAEGVTDMEAVRPNFLVPVYPAYLTVDGANGELVPEIMVDDKAPPVCLIHAHNDRITPAGSALLYLAYQRAARPAELHVYAAGGHGFGMKANGDAINEWPARVAAWMKQIGVLEEK